jgi:hypothetical protein
MKYLYFITFLCGIILINNISCDKENPQSDLLNNSPNNNSVRPYKDINEFSSDNDVYIVKLPDVDLNECNWDMTLPPDQR